MSVRLLINETKNATHLLVKFHEDEQISVIPAKSVTSPAVATLEVSATCSVGWSDRIVPPAEKVISNLVVLYY